MYEINVKNYARWNFHLKNGNFFRLIKTFLECCTRTFVFEWQTLKSAKWRLFHIFFTSIGLVICHSHNYYYIRRHDHQHIIMIIIQCLANVNYILLYLHTSLIFFFSIHFGGEFIFLSSHVVGKLRNYNATDMVESLYRFGVYKWF